MVDPGGHEARSDSRGAPERPGARRRTLAWRFGVVVLATAILGVAAAGCIALEGRATGAMQDELTLSKATLFVDSYRYYGQSFALGARLGSAQLAEEQAFGVAARRAVTAAAARSSTGPALVALVADLEADMGRELALVRAHHLAGAKRFDAHQVAPVFGSLVEKMGRGTAELEDRAGAASADSRRGVIALVFGAGAALLVLFGAYEITRRRRIRAAAEQDVLRRSRERFVALVRNASDLITVVEPDGTVAFEAPSTAGVLGYEPHALVGTDLCELVHPEDRPTFRLLCDEHGHDVGDLRLRQASGTYRSFEVRSSRLLDHPEIRGIVLNGRDVTLHKQLEDDLRHQAFHDTLTGLPNRALFADRVARALSRRRRAERVAVLLVDLDDFKSVNDGLGHAAGDALLAEVASRLQATARTGDTVARLGGDEFAVLLDEHSASIDVSAVAARILEAVAAPARLGEGFVVVGASIGIATAEGGGDPGEVLRNADVAMYVAKRDGKGRYAVFEEAMRTEVEERLTLRNELAVALEAGDQLELHYQPIVRLQTGGFVGVEALVRWNHPARGLVAPMAFVPLAEETGLVVDLGRFVLRNAVAQLARWRNDYPGLGELSVSVNASPRQLEEGGFVEDVRLALADAGLPAQALVLELTETALMRQPDVALERLAALRALGVRIAIDDFGTGYSSLGYLKRLPVDVVKVDRSFTADLGGDGRQHALAEAIVRIGRTLELETVAEGIERNVEVERLRGLSCEYGQGFLFSRPLRASECEALLAGGQRLVEAV